MQVLTSIETDNWGNSFNPEVQAEAVAALENGKIIYLPKLKFEVLPAEKRFLSPTHADPRSKNISYDFQTDSLRGAICSFHDQENFKTMMRRYTKSAQLLMNKLFPDYEQELQIARTSFRPVEIKGRVSSYRKDDTRLHVDAFPATPNQGQRIIRVFTNINPYGKDRVWRVGEHFEKVAERFLLGIAKPWPSVSTLLKALKITHDYRTRYDHYMLHMHNKMKADRHYQMTAQQCEIRFPTATSWIVQTDHVSHAAMSGQYVFEQTFYLPITAMVDPSLSPLRLLEKFMGRPLA